MHPILSTVLERLALGIMTLFLVSVIIFSSIQLLPGDFGEAVLGQAATEDTKAAFRKELGLDQPAYLRYLQWLGLAPGWTDKIGENDIGRCRVAGKPKEEWPRFCGVFQGDFGQSFSGRAASGIDRSRPVVDLVGPRLKNTFFLAAMTSIIAVPLALFLGVTAALYRNSFYDRFMNATTLTTISFPDFFVAYSLVLVFATILGWGNATTNISDTTPFWDRVYQSILPALTLTLVIVAHMMRMTRAAIINLLASPYIEMARLKGVSQSKVIMKHALPNAWAPIATVIAFNLAFLVVGVVVIEYVFVYPGIGQLMVDAVTTRDIPVVQACALVFAATYIILNLIADIISIATNPRLLHPR
ncbi:MAG: ABC transporter permease [Rhizobiaceae bacterium]